MVDTLFSIWEYIHQNLIVYLFIHGFFYEYHVIVKQFTLQKNIIWLHSFHTYE